MYNNEAINKEDEVGIPDDDQIFLLTLKEIREDNKSRIIDILTEHPEAFDLIPIPVDNDIKEVCIENDPSFILRIDQDMISDDLVLYALKVNPFLAKSLWSEIEDDDELIQNLLNQNGLVISCMPDDIKEDERYRTLALSNNPLSMVSLINYMDLDEIKKAVSQKGSVLKYISDGKLYQRVRKIVEESTEDMVVQNNDQFILEMTRSQVRDIYMTACLAKDPFPASSMRKYWLTEDFIIDMVKQSTQSDPDIFYLLSNVPDDLITLDILKAVAEKRPALYFSSLCGYHPTIDEFKELYDISWRVINAINYISSNTSSYDRKKFVRENVLRFGEVSDPLECMYACNWENYFIDYATLPRFAKFISKDHYSMITRTAWDILDNDTHNPQTVVRPATYEYWKKLISIRQGNWLKLFDLCCNSKVYHHYKITRSTKKILRKLKRQEIITYGLIDYLPLTKVNPIGRQHIHLLSICDIILAFKSGIRKCDLIKEYRENTFNPIKMLVINILDKIYDKPVIEPVIGH